MAVDDLYVPDGVFLKCDQGAIITNLKVNPKKHYLYEEIIATEKDNIPITNIPKFGTCSSTGSTCEHKELQWRNVHEGATKIEGQKPLLETSYCKCMQGGNIDIFFEEDAATAALEGDKRGRVDKIPWLDSVLTYVVFYPLGLASDLTGGDSSDIGRGIRQSLAGTWNFLSYDMWQSETRKGMGDVMGVGAVGYIPPNITYSPTGQPSPLSPAQLEAQYEWINTTPEERIANFDESMNTDLTSTHEGIKQACSDFWDRKIENGTQAERGVLTGEVVAFIAELAVGSKGAGAVVKGIKGSAAFANISEKTVASIVTISNFVKNSKLGKLGESIKGIFKVGVGKLNIPQGLSKLQFDELSKFLRDKVGHLSDDIAIHGSRAKGTAKSDSDIDIAIRVDEATFNKMIKERFGTPNPGSAKERTMQHAIETGKIQAGEAGLRQTRISLEAQLGMEVDISIIKKDGVFDNPPYIPIK